MPSRKYVSRPIEIEAMQYDGTPECAAEIVAWAERVGGPTKVYIDRSGLLVVQTLENGEDTWLLINPTSWAVKGTENEFYPVRNDVFQRKYEAVSPRVPRLSGRAINKVLHQRCGHFVDVDAYALVAAREDITEDELRRRLA